MATATFALMTSEHASRVAATSRASGEAVVAMLERFFHYLALQQLDPAVELWDVPAFILADAYVHGPMSRPQLERLLAEAVPLAREESLAGQRPRAGSRQGAFIRPEDCFWVGQRVARVHASWPEQAFAGLLSDAEESEFLVRIDEAGLPKIRALTLLPAGFPRPFSER